MSAVNEEHWGYDALCKEVKELKERLSKAEETIAQQADIGDVNVERGKNAKCNKNKK